MSGIPNYVSFQTALARRSTFDGTLNVGVLKRLAECLAKPEGALHVHLEIQPERGAAPHLLGRIEGPVWLVCQRCMQVYEEPVAVQLDLRLVTTEAEENRLMQDAEPYLVEDDRLPLHALIEDEVLLALPMAPHCAEPACHAAFADDADRDE